MFYRPSYPSWRAQDIQVLHAAHSLAELGHFVTILGNRTDSASNSESVLKQFDLPPSPNLNLKLSPTQHLGLSGLWFRQAVLSWWHTHTGVIIVRDIPRLARMLPWLKRKQRIVIEAHQLPSLNAADQSKPFHKLHKMETKVLQHSWALITNCGGVMHLWEEHHASFLPKRCMVVHNGTSPSRQVEGATQDEVIRCLGSLRPEKGLVQLLPALQQSPIPIELIGASPLEIKSLGGLPEHIKVHPPVPYPKVPELLSTARALLLPLQNNRFGRSLTSPLKLWDYLATDRPILAPDLPSIREIASLTGRELLYYEPDKPLSLLVLLKNNFPDASPPYLRSWTHRATEISQLIQS